MYVSLCSIPSRWNTHLHSTLTHLQNQTYPIDHIYVTTPHKIKRIPEPKLKLGSELKIELELEQLEQKPKFNNVTYIEPSIDHGPIMKYLSVANYVHGLVFICDDDQNYHPTLLERMVAAYVPGSVVCSTVSKVLWLQNTNGYGGLLVPSEILMRIKQQYIKPCCTHVDDNWISNFWFQNNINIINLDLKPEEIFATVINNPEDGLNKTTNRNTEGAACIIKMSPTLLSFTMLIGIIVIIIPLFIFILL